MEAVEEKELAYWLAVCQVPKIGGKRLAALLSVEEKLSAFFNGREPTEDFWTACHLLGIQERATFCWRSIDKALAWRECSSHHILTWQHPDYPAILKRIASSPPILYVDGELTSVAGEGFAIVGSRHPSEEGKANAFHFARELGASGFTIVSGLAYGIDRHGHEGALAAPAKTLAILGQGIDRIYPSAHEALADKIRANGAILSEFPLGMPPRSEHFPRRNRIISGLSVGVLIVESSLKSGSLITARYALSQDREVFAIPGSIHNPLAKGCHALIREGAKCVETLEHILEELPRKVNVISPLLTCFEGKFSSVDCLIQKSGLTAEQVSSMLIELELRGEITSVPGGYVRTARGV